MAKKTNRQPQPPKVCPICGEDVPPRSLACPECGADHETGWKEDADAYGGGLDLADDEFDYDDFVAREFGSKAPKPRGVSLFWWIVGIILTIVFGLCIIRFR